MFIFKVIRGQKCYWYVNMHTLSNFICGKRVVPSLGLASNSVSILQQYLILKQCLKTSLPHQNGAIEKYVSSEKTKVVSVT